MNARTLAGIVAMLIIAAAGFSVGHGLGHHGTSSSAPKARGLAAPAGSSSSSAPKARGLAAPSAGSSSSTGVVTACAAATATGTTLDAQTAPAHTVAVDGGDITTTPAVTFPGVTIADSSATDCQTATYTNATTTIVVTAPATTTTPSTTTSSTSTSTSSTTAPAPPTTTTSTTSTTPTTTRSLANLHVDADGGTCTPTSAPAPYADAAACPSVDAALRALPLAGGIIDLRCGAYPTQNLSSNAARFGTALVQSASNRCARIVANNPGGAAATFGTGVNYVTLANLTIEGRVIGTTRTGVGAGNNHVAVTDDTINDGLPVNGQSVLFSVGDYVDISRNTIGPTISQTIACSPSCGSPEGIRIGKPNSAVASCDTQVCHLTIDDNDIRYVTRNCSYWPLSGWGTCPGATCANADGCHEDAIHIWGVDGGDISGNKVYGDECQGLFIENTNASLQRDVRIVNNAVSTLVGGCSNKGIYIQAGSTTDGATRGFAGNWLIAFNSGTSSIIGPNGCGSCWPTARFRFVGNNMGLFVTNATGNNGGCFAPWGPASVVYDHNVWRPGGTNTACGPTDVVAAPPFVNAAIPPATGIDLHAAGTSIATGYVPAAICASITPIDMDGDPRNGNCSAGADQG